jgi:hypothetical protein
VIPIFASGVKSKRKKMGGADLIEGAESAAGDSTKNVVCCAAGAGM